MGQQSKNGCLRKNKNILKHTAEYEETKSLLGSG
jgi:hypothetical protein